MSNTFDKIKGRAKEVAGKAVGDKKMELKGKMEHDIADMKQRAKELRDDQDNRRQNP